MINSPKPIRVVHVLPSLEFGGAEKMVLDLAGVQKRGEGVVPQLVCLKEMGELKELADERGIPCTVVGLQGIRFVSPMFRLYRFFLHHKPDIVHTHNYQSQFHAAPAARLARIPVVQTKHGKTITKMSWSPYLRRSLYNLAEKIVVVSRETGESVQAKTGLKSSKMMIIYNGIDVDRYSNLDRLQSRQSLGLSDRTVVFGSVSRLDPIKDHVTMLRAFEKVTRKHENSMLLIVGDGPARIDIEHMVKEMSLGDKVILTGFSDNVSSLLAGMDLFLQTSIEEGLSLSILEAAASGIPIVATDVGGTPEIIQNGKHGILLDSGNVDAFAEAMNRFIENPEPFKVMAVEAKKVIKRQFSLESMVHSYESLYRGILNNKGVAVWAES